MSNGDPDSTQTLGAMSPTRRQLRLNRRGERDFLADQATDAKAAMAHTLHDIKHSAGKAVNVRLCAGQHPWILIGSAVAAGFAAGIIVTPARPKLFKDTQSSDDAESQPRSQGQETPRTKQTFLLSIVGTVLASILRTVVQASIAAAVDAKDQPTEEAVASDGVMGAGAAKNGAT